MSEVLDFMRILFADKPDKDKILVWTLDDRFPESSPNKRLSHWYDSAESAAGDIERLVSTSDVSIYIGCCTSIADLGPHARARVEEIGSMVGLWADIDYHKAGSAKKYPDGWNAVSQILNEMPFKPSLVVETGGGVHVWWLFREPWVLEGQDRQRAAALSRRWQKILASKASRYGFDIDSTFDLARVLRPAGTTNWKYGKPVRIKAHEAFRYNPVEVEDEIAAYPIPDDVNRPAIKVGDIKLDPDCQIPSAVHELIATSAAFDLAWKMRRKDLGSQSEYDLALASVAAQAECSDQVIADIIISHRRIHRKDLKLRPDYYQRTISKARSAGRAEIAKEQLDETVRKIEEGEKPKDKSARDDILSNVSAVFGFRVNKIVKYVSDEPSYAIKTERGNVIFPNIGSMTSHKLFVDCVAKATEQLIHVSKKDFKVVVQAILSAVEYEDLGADTRAETKVSEWLRTYFSTIRPISDKNEAMLTRTPFIDGARIGFFSDAFRGWVYHSMSERLEGRTLPTMLRAAGAVPETVAVKDSSEDRWATAYVWFIEKAILWRSDDGAKGPRPARSGQDNMAEASGPSGVGEVRPAQGDGGELHEGSRQGDLVEGN